MRTFSSEFAHNYKTYSFGYCNYVLREPGDRLADIYARGYLPYSGKAGVEDTFYMARSARVNLDRFSLSSENWRIAKRFDGTLARETVPREAFDSTDGKFIDFCLSYFNKRHGPDIMPRKRLEHILNFGIISNVSIYRNNDSLVAYVFEVSDQGMTHFWYSFYDLAYVQQSLGMWLMLDALRQTKTAGKKHFYVGTVYGDKALYKANFPGLEYWDGQGWVPDTARLKALARSNMNTTQTKSRHPRLRHRGC